MKTKSNLRANYYYTLKYFVDQCSGNDEYIAARVAQYHDLFIGKDHEPSQLEDMDRVIKSIVNNLFKPWRRNLRYFLMCDIAFILVNKSVVRCALKLLKNYLRKKQYVFMKKVFKNIFADANSIARVSCADVLLNQIRKNRFFTDMPQKRILITANMSAGKSTLINAIIGKQVTRTAQEACTVSLSYLYNKPFEDNAVHLLASPINFNANAEELLKKNESEKIYIASYFRTTIQLSHRICMIDTPGVNSSLHQEHGLLTRKALSEEEYDTLIYVFNAGKLGTDEELKHLKHISENIPKEKIVFVVNKLDDYKSIDDSIESSIDGVRNDLSRLGYENPIICPISAYFAFLIKMKQNDETLTEDDEDLFNLLAKKFCQQGDDLSRYYSSSAGETFEKNDKLS
jgi:signal recognition particle receptor subunit beta